MIQNKQGQFNRADYDITRTFLIHTGQEAFISAYIAFGILESAATPSLSGFKPMTSWTEKILVSCECGLEMVAETAGFVCPRCGEENRLSYQELLSILQDELGIFLEMLRPEVPGIAQMGIDYRAEYIEEYQKRFELNQEKHLADVLRCAKETDMAADVEIDAWIDRAASFQRMVTKISPIWWKAQFNKQLEQLLADEIGDELIEMQVRCVMVERVRNHRRALKIGYSLPF